MGNRRWVQSMSTAFPHLDLKNILIPLGSTWGWPAGSWSTSTARHGLRLCMMVGFEILLCKQQQLSNDFEKGSAPISTQMSFSITLIASPKEKDGKEQTNQPYFPQETRPKWIQLHHFRRISALQVRNRYVKGRYSQRLYLSFGCGISHWFY